MNEPGRWYHNVHDLIPFRVRELLLVASPYDAYTLEEDAGLADRLLEQYSELRLTSSPRITFAATGARALELIEERSFDLVITMVRLGDVEAMALGEQIKAVRPDLAVVLLGFREADFMRVQDATKIDLFDGMFVWTGDAAIVLAIIKQIEDQRNVEHDTREAGVRVMLVVEDSVRRYSSFLILLYSELLRQSASLIAEGLNHSHKVMRMRARPKILLAKTYEEACECFKRYERYMFAVISDVRFPKDGVENPEAGFELIEHFRERRPELPVLMQSAEADLGSRAAELGVAWAQKASTHLPIRLKDFFTENLGFGDFVFRLQDRTVVGRARNVYEMESILLEVPAESIVFHADNNHFSQWLRARNMLQLATRVRPATIESCGGVDGFRRTLRRMLREAHVEESAGLITDFSDRGRGYDTHFLRLGTGSIGGKARGIAFLSALVQRRGLVDKFEGLRIRTPRTVAVATELFDRFLQTNGLVDLVASDAGDEAIVNGFLEAAFDDGFLSDLRAVQAELAGPLAVRSSSLLEDAQFQPFAGIYETCLLPNAHPSPNRRFEQMCQAIKYVFASTFSKNARAYLEGTPYTVDEEKMGIVVQEMVGQRYGDRFYPTISGVALSYNFYPVGDQRPEDGLVLLALGLGRSIVSGGQVLQFCPKTPGQLPQFPTPRDALQHSQKKFYAVNMAKPEPNLALGPDETLIDCTLADAEEDGTLALAASVYDAPNDVLRENLRDKGPRVITFSNLLKWNAFPLAEALDEILTVARSGMGSPVEIEFAVDVPEGWKPELNLLQIRPQVTQTANGSSLVADMPDEGLLVRSAQALGHGVVEGLQDVVYTRTGAKVDHNSSRTVAERVGNLNRDIGDRGYVLIGPGRWGSSDASLGVPVQWAQISFARVIVEIPFEDRIVEPSQGSHFFHNIASLGIGYITLTSTDDLSCFDREWLDAQPSTFEDDLIRHVKIPAGLTVYLDGPHCRAAIVKPNEERQ